MNIYEKLMTARMLLFGTKLEKSGWNDFSKYKYFELGDFLPQTMGIFNNVGLCGLVSFTAGLATLRVVDIDDDTKEILFTSPMGSANLKGCHEIQNIGAVELYQRRYLWVAAMEIVEHDAIDSRPLDAEQPKPKKQAEKTPDAPPSLSDEDMDTVGFAMEEAPDIVALKKIFGDVYKKGSEQQQTALKKQYDGIKSKNKWESK